MPHLLFAFANDLEQGHRFLRELSRERQGLEAALHLGEQMGLCRRKYLYDATSASIIDTFQQHAGEITIFHYGGHAGSFDLLLQNEEGGNEAAGGEGMVSFLGRQQGLQLVFLNGCHTEQLAMRLLEAGVPAVIGTHTTINDRMATRLAIRFYQGLGTGLTIERSFLDAVDSIRMSPQGGNLRSLYWEGMKTHLPGDVPWSLQHAPGRESALQWSLALNDPLLGLPDLPADIALPEQPFVFFQRYRREHARVFFGRSHHIRALYDRIEQIGSPPVILLHGQSGAGKSSLFEAGLRPRLEARYRIVYVRHERSLIRSLNGALIQLSEAYLRREIPEASGLDKEALRTLLTQLDEVLREGDSPTDSELHQDLRTLSGLRRLADTADETSVRPSRLADDASLSARWRWIEAAEGRPLVVVLDQVEEAFHAESESDDWKDFVQVLVEIFGNPATAPQGKLILGYRKEYHPEILSGLKAAGIPRHEIFLPVLTRPEVEEIVSGLANPLRRDLQQAYQVEVEAELPSLIAADLVRDASASVAPVLQILLTHMWEKIAPLDPGSRIFSEALYLDLKQQGLLLRDFFLQQESFLRQEFPEEVALGLHLDLLWHHTTSAGTSCSHHREEVQEVYQTNPGAILPLIHACEQRFLLRRAGDFLALAHDTLAPVVREAYEHADLPGQRARRMLEGRVQGVESPGDLAERVLDRLDLAQVHAGKNGMRDWTEAETALVKASEAREQKRKRGGYLVRAAVFALLLGILGVGLYSWQQGQLLLASREQVTQVADSLSRVELQLDQSALSLAQTTDALEQRAAEIQERDSQLTGLNLTLIEKQVAVRKTDAIARAQAALNALGRDDKYGALQEALAAYRLAPKEPVVLRSLLTAANYPGWLYRQWNAWPDALPLEKKGSNACRDQLSDVTFSNEIAVRNAAGDTLFVRKFSSFIEQAAFVAGTCDLIAVEIGDSQKYLFRYDRTPSIRQGLPAGAVRSLAWDDSRQALLWASQEKGAGIRSVEEGSSQQRTETAVQSVAVSSDGESYAWISATNLRIQSATEPAQQWAVQPPQGLSFLRGHFSIDNNRLLTTMTGAAWCIWDLRRPGQAPEKIGKATAGTRFLDAVFCPDSRLLISGEASGQLNLWDWEQESVVLSHTLPGPVQALSFSPDAAWLGVACGDGAVYLYPWRQPFRFANPIRIPHDGPVNALDWHIDKGRYLLTACADQKIRYIRINAPSYQHIWTHDVGSPINDIVYGASGQQAYVATAQDILGPMLLNPQDIIQRFQPIFSPIPSFP